MFCINRPYYADIYSFIYLFIYLFIVFSFTIRVINIEVSKLN